MVLLVFCPTTAKRSEKESSFTDITSIFGGKVEGEAEN